MNAVLNAPAPPSLQRVRDFAYLQGPGKTLFATGARIDDAEATSSTAPPAAARGTRGIVLPLDSARRLAVAYPSGRLAAPRELLPPGERLAHLLLAANGLQHREPSHRYNDHRSVASGRAKFPVHIFTYDVAGLRYLDHYRHALVDIELTAIERAVDPRSTRVILAARYCDLPTPYQRMRASIGETELGINLRSLFLAAELCGVQARIELDGEITRWADALVHSTGPGDWSAPIVVTLGGLEAPAASVALPGSSVSSGIGVAEHARFEAADRHLVAAGTDPTVREACTISASRTTIATPLTPANARGIPTAARHAHHEPTWAQVLTDRSAGRMPGRLNGFATLPASVDDNVARDFVAWVSQPSPHCLLAEIDARVTVRIALQRVGSLPTGLYRLDGDDLVPERVDPVVMSAIQMGFGHQPSPDTEIGIRHASMAWVFCADVDQVVADFGPPSWSLLQMCLGWRMHGLCVAAAAHRMFARPARSYDERRLQRLLHLERKDVPVFMTVCGKSRFCEPLLDLRP